MNAWRRWLGQPIGHADKGMAKAAAGHLNLEKKDAINPMIALQGLAEANWGDVSYSGMARNGYLSNPVVHRSVKMISQAASSLPWLVYENGHELDVHPLLDLLANPAPNRAGAAFLDRLYSGLLIAGNAYIHRIDLDGMPVELNLLRADCINRISDDTGWPIAYEYSVNGIKQHHDVTGENPPLLHISFYNPLDEFDGIPPLHAARMALEIHNAASNWNKALLDNSARPSGALVYSSSEDINLTEEQFDRLKHELEDGYSGASSAGRPMLLEGGLDWKPMGLSPKDMDFMEARNGAAREIALAFGIPPMLLGIPGDNTYSNYQEANRAFWRQTVMPLVTQVTKSLEGWLSPLWGKNLRLDVDRDAIEALAVDREALWRRVNEADFLTVNEKREATGYGRLEDDQSI